MKLSYRLIMTTTILAILLTLSVALSAPINWTQPEAIFSSPKPMIVYSTYTDPVTSIHHIVFTAGQFGYMKMHPDKTVSAPVYFKVPFANKVAESIFISGAADGKTLYITVSASKKLYFIESKDSGRTWSTPTDIVKGNRECYNRGSALHIRATGQVFVFYIVYTYHYYALAYVTRLANSSVFGKEKIFLTIEEPRYNSLFAAEAKINGVNTIVLTYKLWDDNKPQYVMYSVDNGATWSNPALMDGTSSSDLFGGRLALNPNITNRIFLTYDMTLSSFRIRYSDDAGESWSSTIRATTNRFFMVDERPHSALEMCGTKGNAKLVGIYQLEYGVVDYVTMDPAVPTPVFGPTPFSSLNKMQGVWLGCTQVHEKIRVSAFTVVESKIYYSEIML